MRHLTEKSNRLFGSVLGAIVLTAWITSGALAAQERPDQEFLKAKPEIVEAWKDMRFGMFLCWGPVSLTGEEIGWSRGAPAWGRREGLRGGKGVTPAEVYDNLYKTWKPDKFDAEQWVRVAKETGQQYMIFLVKHHDGFSLYDTKLSDYKSTGPESAWKVDVMRAVADACHKHDLKLIIYYSQPDWHHPDYLGERHDRYTAYLHGQIRELLTNYGKIDGLWFDNLRGRGNNPEAAKLWDSEKLFKMARSIQPHLIINDRCGLDADFYTPEQNIGGFNIDRPWETCMTLGTQWSWKPNDKVKSLKEAIDVLVRCAAGDGNLALNTNPMPDGRIEPRQAARFREIGQWMKKNEQSIRGTRGGPVVPAKWGGTTRKDDTVYVHVLNWTTDKILLPSLGRKILSHRVLTGGSATVERTGEGIAIGVAPKDRDPIDTIVALKLDGSAMDIAPIVPPIVPPKGVINIGAKATASGEFSEGYSAAMAFDGDEETRWGGAPESRTGWLAMDLGKPMTFSGVAILEEPWNRVEKFQLQYMDGAIWKTFHEGTTLGAFQQTFEPITAQRVRLDILKATDVPTLWEFHLIARPAEPNDPDRIQPAPSLPETTPWDLKALSEPPDFQWAQDGQIRSLYYKSVPFKGKTTRAFAYYATPGTLSGDPGSDKNLPAIVLVHGGGGEAFKEWAELWAQRGYAAIAMDLAGVGPDKKRLPDGGPGQGHDEKFGTIGLPVAEQWTYHAAANAILAHSLILSFPEVDPKRTALTGISWGGYLTCIVAGLDNRFKAAVPVYGCGFLHDNSCWLGEFEKMTPEHKKKWIQLWDPSQYIGSASMPMLFVDGGKDFAYPPDSHAKTFALVKSPKNLHFVPNLPHGHIFDKPKAIEVFIDSRLKEGIPLARIHSIKHEGNSITANVETKTKLTSARLCYTFDALPGDAGTRKWIEKPATITGNRIAAELPDQQTVIWFLTVLDERDTMVSSELVFPGICGAGFQPASK